MACYTSYRNRSNITIHHPLFTPWPWRGLCRPPGSAHGTCTSSGRQNVIIQPPEKSKGEPVLSIFTDSIWGFPARHGGSPKMDGFCWGNSYLEMDDNVWGSPMTKRKPPSWASLCLTRLSKAWSLWGCDRTWISMLKKTGESQVTFRWKIQTSHTNSESVFRWCEVTSPNVPTGRRMHRMHRMRSVPCSVRGLYGSASRVLGVRPRHPRHQKNIMSSWY